MKAGTRLAAALACALAAVAIAAIPAGASGGEVAKAACQLSQGEQRGDLGSSYVYSLKARNLGCERAKRLLIKVNECRRDNGGRDGSCPGVKGYDCKQKELDSSLTIFSAKVKCEKGSKKMVATIGELT